MQVKVDIDKIGIIQSEQINSGEYNTRELQFNIAENMRGLILKALFTKDYKTYEVDIENDSCMIPWEVLKTDGNCELGVYAYSVDGEVLEIRYSPEPTKFYINAGSYKTEVENGEQPIPTRTEVLEGKIKELDNKKVDKKEGYGLSQNDFTNELKTKLDNAGKQEDIDKLKSENQEQAEQINYLDKTLTRAEASGENINIKDSAEYPISNISIDTNIKQDTREGYNELNFNVEQNSKVTVNDDGTITINGTGGFGLNFEEITLKTGVTYRQRIELVSGSVTGNNINNTFMAFNSSVWLTTNSSVVTTPTEDMVKNSMWVNGSTTFDNARIKIWGYQGNIDKPYEQYGAMPSIEFPSEIKTPVGKQSFYVGNKNWLPTDKSKWESGHYDVNGIKTNYLTRMRLIDLLPIQSNTTYCASDTNGTETFILRGFNNKKEFVQNIGIIHSYNNNPTFKTNEDVAYLGVSVDITYSDYVEENHQLFMYLNSETDKSFIAHQSQVQDLDVGELLGPIVDKEDGSYFENRYERLRLTSDMSWALSGNNYWYRVIIAELSKTIESTILSTHFKGIDSNGNKTNYAKNYENSYICLGTGGNGLVGISVATFESLDVLKTFLDENEVYIVGELQTPTYTKLTDEQQAQWNKIKKMHTYEGVTNIYTINENGISPVINMKYVKSPKVVEENLQAQIDKINSAIVALGAV